MAKHQRLVTIAPVFLYFIAVLILSCLVSMMISFMGGKHTSGDGQLLLGVQRAGSVVCLLMAGFAFSVFLRDGFDGAFARLWQHIPGWLLFACLILNLLALSGVGAYWLVASVLDPDSDSVNYVSLLCLSSASLAYLAVSAAAHFLAGKPPFDKSRW
ncbi:MAG: hypothetical protein ACR2QB_05265 [Gammaproteobacteria bacterium]